MLAIERYLASGVGQSTYTWGGEWKEEQEEQE